MALARASTTRTARPLSRRGAAIPPTKPSSHERSTRPDTCKTELRPSAWLAAFKSLDESSVLALANQHAWFAILAHRVPLARFHKGAPAPRAWRSDRSSSGGSRPSPVLRHNEQALAGLGLDRVRLS